MLPHFLLTSSIYRGLIRIWPIWRNPHQYTPDHPGVCDDVNLKTLVQTEEELLPSGHQAPKHKPSLTKAKVEEGLSTAESIAITTDGWTSRATDSYMTITAHYITGNWQIANHVLQTRPVYLWFAAQAVSLSYLSLKQ